MIAYKLLRSGSIGPLSGFPWPTPFAATQPGPWVEAAPNPISTGIHATTAEEIRLWIAEELWLIELEGDVRREGATLVAPRGRLVRRVESWDEAGKAAFIDDCDARVARYAEQSPEAAPFTHEIAEDRRVGRPEAAAKDAEIAAFLAGGPSLQASELSAQSRWFGRLVATG